MTKIPIKYIVKKDIPFKPTPLKKGDVIDSSFEFIKYLDLSDNDFFMRYIEPIYTLGEELLYTEFNKTEVYNVTSVSGDGKYTIRNGSGKLVNITDKTKNVKPPKRFWFINSNGIISQDFEERKNINFLGLEYKKITGNYFLTQEDAISHKKYLIAK